MVVVVVHVAVPHQRPEDEHGEGGPAQQDDTELQQVPLAQEVHSSLRLHPLTLPGVPGRREGVEVEGK